MQEQQNPNVSPSNWILDEEGLASDVSQLRQLVHHLVHWTHEFMDLPQIVLNAPGQPYEALTALIANAHALVCPDAAAIQQMIGARQELGIGRIGGDVQKNQSFEHLSPPLVPGNQPIEKWS